MTTLRVLVADDEAGMRHSISRALADHTFELPDVDDSIGFKVECVSSGEESLEHIAVDPPDLLLLDHRMGGMSGVDVLEQLANRERDFLVIMITAFATIETAVRATKSGAFDFIAKPFTPDELKETIRKAASHLLAHRQARKLTEEKRRVRFEFIRVLGHELKAPLAAIENYLIIMRQHGAGDALASYHNVIDRCVVRAGGMRKLITDLLDLTRIEAGEKKREFAEVDVVEAARHAIENAQLAAEDRGITLQLHRTEPLMMDADRGEIEIVLNNLVSNAVRYNKDGGRVDVRLSADDNRVTISVSDTGIGMTAEETARLFRDFVRIKNDKTRNIAGSGLGLSIIKKISQLYGGQASVSSRPDEGSEFVVTLKRRPSEEDGADES